MLTGAHVVVFSKDAEADRAFAAEVLGLSGVDAGGGWMIYALPPAEIAFHPAGADETGRHALYLMCEDIAATRAALAEKGVETPEPVDEGWGIMTRITLPSGASAGLYQPRHPVPRHP